MMLSVAVEKKERKGREGELVEVNRDCMIRKVRSFRERL